MVGLAAAVIGGTYVGQVTGSILGVGTLGSLVGTFVYGSRSRKKERSEKREKIEK